MTKLLFIYLLSNFRALALRVSDRFFASTASSWPAHCNSEEYGREGKWNHSESEWGPQWNDKNCGTLPEFNIEKFCVEKLKCQNILFVGDSTASMFYFALWETMTGFKERMIGGQNQPIAPNKKATENDHSVDCGKPQYDGEPNRRPICQQQCPTQVHMTLIRHDHLNGPQFAKGQREACAWKQELASHPHVVLHTGTHVGDSEQLLQNKQADGTLGIWESRAEDLFKFLADVHPQGIIWRPAHVGIMAAPMNASKCLASQVDYKYAQVPLAESADEVREAEKTSKAWKCGRRWPTTCGDKRFIRDSPLRDDEIDTHFGRTWQKFPAINRVYIEALHKHLPLGVVLNTASLMSMRGDCRGDPIHFIWHEKKAPIHAWIRMLQYFMT